MRFWFSSGKKIWPAATASPTAGPDFICVGMVKAATAWLFDQLRYHPDFWLPSLKEFRYLDHVRPTMVSAHRRLSFYSSPRLRKAAGPADVALTEEAAALKGQPMDLEKYAALFRYRGERLSGDISPGYNRLSEQRIAQVAARFPHVKIILLARDPVARAWSHVSMFSRENQFDPSLLENPSRFAAWFAASAARRGSLATNVFARWKAVAPQVAFRYFLFDDIERHPAAARRDIIEYLGADPKRWSGWLPAHFNRKKDQVKLTLTDPIKAVLVEQLADELRASARVFGGAAEEWPARYGL